MNILTILVVKLILDSSFNFINCHCHSQLQLNFSCQNNCDYS